MSLKESIHDNWRYCVGVAFIAAGAYLLWGTRAMGWILFIGGLLMCCG